MTYYKTFKRSCTDWSSFAKGRKTTIDTGLTYDQARERCKKFNDARNARQISKGTMMEFTAQ